MSSCDAFEAWRARVGARVHVETGKRTAPTSIAALERRQGLRLPAGHRALVQRYGWIELCVAASTPLRHGDGFRLFGISPRRVELDIAAQTERLRSAVVAEAQHSKAEKARARREERAAVDRARGLAGGLTPDERPSWREGADPLQMVPIASTLEGLRDVWLAGGKGPVRWYDELAVRHRDGVSNLRVDQRAAAPWHPRRGFDEAFVSVLEDLEQRANEHANLARVLELLGSAAGAGVFVDERGTVRSSYHDDVEVTVEPDPRAPEELRILRVVDAVTPEHEVPRGLLDAAGGAASWCRVSYSERAGGFVAEAVLSFGAAHADDVRAALRVTAHVRDVWNGRTHTSFTAHGLEAPTLAGGSDNGGAVLDPAATRVLAEGDPLAAADQVRRLAAHARWLRRKPEAQHGWSTYAGDGLVLAVYTGTNRSRGQADLARIDLRGLDFTGAQLTAANLVALVAEGVSFRGARLDHAMAIDGFWRDADLAGASVVSTDFSRSDLRGVSFRGADCTATDFERCDLTGADFTGATLTRASFKGAKNPPPG